MTPKDVIAQAEIKWRKNFDENYAPYGEENETGWKYGAPSPQSVKAFISNLLSSYTKDLLQSVESELDVLDTCLEGLPMAGDGLITQKLYASDVVKRLKEVKADIISKLK